MTKQSEMSGCLRRLLGLTLAILFVCLTVQGLSHSHKQGQTEATCQICHAAHLPCIPGLVALEEPAPFTAIGYVVPIVLNFHETVIPGHSSSRAPPAV